MNRSILVHCACVSTAAFFLHCARAETLFLEAETFKTPSDGWQVKSSEVARAASGVAVLSGSGGAPDGVATATVSVKEAGHYRVWVRYTSHPKWRGPFRVTARQGDRKLGGELFDTGFEAKSVRDN
ncbi:MAG: hypothetical protein M3463_03640 [Verrucomicrobiota bacterium]|nr:hypothetical protein [Verrucomicrobiota bacterium]